MPSWKKPPREYFLAQCYLTMDADESTLGAMVGLNPHFDCTYPGVLKEVRGAISGLPEISQRHILTDNAIRFYNL